MFLCNKLIISVLLGVDRGGISSLRSLEQMFGYFPAQELLKNIRISGKDCWVAYYRIKETSLKRYCRFSPFSVSMTNSPSGNTPVIFPRKVPEASL